MIHNEPHELAGKTATIREDATHPQVEDFGGSELHIEDWWDRARGKSWKMCRRNPACMIYRQRLEENDLPGDDEVVYGKIGMFGHLVHVSELKETDND